MTSEYGKSLSLESITLVSLLELRQSNLSNPETYSKPYQTSNMKYFAKIVKGYKLLTFLVKDSILDGWQGQYAAVVCYSLLGKTEDADKFD